METNKYSGITDNNASQSGSQDVIGVRALMTCPSCGWRKAFRNQFYRRDIEMMVVALKVFDWLTCPRCGDLIDLNIEYEI